MFEFGTPLTVAETASIFGETIVLGRLLEQAADAAERLSLLGSSLDGAVGAVFRQIAMNRFEDRVHRRRRESGELSVDDFGAAWIESQTEMLGDTVELTEGYSSWWSYVPHFISTPGYVYAYSFGHLLALSVYSRYEQEGEGFVDSYVELLKAGGSRSPEGLGEIVGVDLADPGFWNAGLDLIERQLEAAEETAQAVTDDPLGLRRGGVDVAELVGGADLKLVVAGVEVLELVRRVAVLPSVLVELADEGRVGLRGAEHEPGRAAAGSARADACLMLVNGGVPSASTAMSFEPVGRRGRHG